MKESSDISLTVARNIVKGTKYAKVRVIFHFGEKLSEYEDGK